MTSLPDRVQSWFRRLLEKVRESPRHRAAVFATVTAFVYYALVRPKLQRSLRRWSHLPQGPVGLPLLGTTLQEVTNCGAFQLRNAKDFSGQKMFYVHSWLGRSVYIHNADVIRKLENHPAMQDRPDAMNALFSRPDINSVKGEEWRNRRRFLFSNLVTLADSKYVSTFITNAVQTIIAEELRRKIAATKQGVLVWDPKDAVECVVFNVVYGCVFGKLLPAESQEFKDLHTFSSTFTSYVWPSMLLVILGVPKENVMSYKSSERTHRLIESHFEDHRREYDIKKAQDPNYQPTCLADSLLDEEKQLQQRYQLNATQIKADFLVLLLAGFETTSVVVRGGLYLLATVPDLQERLRAEMVQNCGGYNLDEFRLEKSNEYPLLRAFVHETMRFVAPVVGGSPRELAQDMEIEVDGKQYRFKKGTFVWAAIYAICRDAKIWKNPFGVCLDNWLTVNSKGQYKFRNRKDLFVFGFGGRHCLGQTIALRTLCALFGMLLLQYRFGWDAKSPPVMWKRTSFSVPSNFNLLVSLL